MRIFIMIIMFAIGFSGYSAAAHASAMESCGSAAIEQSADCADHNIDSHESDSHKAGKNICLDCHHCCTSHVASMPDYFLNPPPQAALDYPAPAQGYSDYFAFSLLRPPKTLV